MRKKIETITILKIIAIMMLVWALADHPYAYYQILRWFIAGMTGYSAYIAYGEEKIAWTWILGIIAVLYNPIAPIYLDRETWSIIDLAVAAIIFASMIKTEFIAKKWK